MKIDLLLKKGGAGMEAKEALPHEYNQE